MLHKIEIVEQNETVIYILWDIKVQNKKLVPLRKLLKPPMK